MRMFLRVTLMSAIVVFFTSVDWKAMVDGQLLVGARSGGLEDCEASTSGSVTRLAGHIDPLPFMPVAFGGFVEATSDGIESIRGKGISTGPELQIWANIGDLIAYVTVKRRDIRRLVAILEVVQKFLSHASEEFLITTPLLTRSKPTMRPHGFPIANASLSTSN